MLLPCHYFCKANNVECKINYAGFSNVPLFHLGTQAKVMNYAFSLLTSQILTLRALSLKSIRKMESPIPNQLTSSMSSKETTLM